MAMTSDPTRIAGIDHGELRDKWGWFVALGVVMLIAGVIAMLNLFAATVVSVLYVGALMLVGGVFRSSTPLASRAGAGSSGGWPAASFMRRPAWSRS